LFKYALKPFAAFRSSQPNVFCSLVIALLTVPVFTRESSYCFRPS